MAKGIAQRRRLKRALEAARGNLHKISNGKALPTDLPEAPKPTDAEKLPASLRKMLALKEFAAQKDRKGNHAGVPSGPQGSKTSNSKRTQRAPKGSEDAEDGPSTSGRDGQQAQPQKKDTGSGAAPVKGANAFQEQFAVRKLKDRKKDYLKRKEEKRKKGAGGPLVVEKELQLKDNVKFGEVVDAPLQINLKRKHWADKEKTANERCKEVFLKQMQQAQQRLAGAAAGTDEGIAVRTGGGGRAGGTGKERSSGKGGPQKQGGKRKAPMDQETEELRQQVIASYRAAKKGAGLHNASEGNATLASLSRLVGKGGAGGGKTHTLA